MRDSVQVGDRLPLTVGAAGHVMRAFNGARGERFDEIRQACTPRRSASAIRRPRRWRCPVFGPGNKLVGALSVSGPRYRIEAAGEARIVPVLFKHAKELTRTFGGLIDDPTLMGWNQAKSRRGKAAGATKRAGGKAAIGDEPA